MTFEKTDPLQVIEDWVWSYDKLGDYYYCQSCGGTCPNHEPGCRLVTVLSAAEEMI